MGGIDEAALDRLSLVTEMTRHIRVKAGSASGELQHNQDRTQSFSYPVTGQKFHVCRLVIQEGGLTAVLAACKSDIIHAIHSKLSLLQASQSWLTSPLPFCGCYVTSTLPWRKRDGRYMYDLA